MSWELFIDECKSRLAYQERRGEYTGVTTAKLDIALRARYTSHLSESTGLHHCIDCFEPFDLGKGPCKKPRKPLPEEEV